jgi:hypothetical protein
MKYEVILSVLGQEGQEIVEEELRSREVEESRS